MPLFSDYSSYSGKHYSATPSYSASSPYSSYVSSVPGSSFSASYLGTGSGYSKHSSLGGYSRSPLIPSRWIPPSGRTYSPLLTTISERGNSSPVRITSPRRIPITKSYVPSSYTPRPININTADIDVSRDKYKTRIKSFELPIPQRNEPSRSRDNSPFMPRIDGKPETGIDSSPGHQRSTIRRGRTVVRLHTIKRKERDSPRKPNDLQNDTMLANASNIEQNEEPGTGWRERLSEDLQYKDKREKKTLGEKLVEKFKVKNNDDEDLKINVTSSVPSCYTKLSEANVNVVPQNVPSRSPDRRCSMELLAEQANLLDSLIRKENLSTTSLDLSKVGTVEETSTQSNQKGSIRNKKRNASESNLQTTKSDHSLHDRVKSLSESKECKQYHKRKSLRKSASGGCISRLDSITEFPKEAIQFSLPSIEENRLSIKSENVNIRPKLKPKITSTVEVTEPKNVLKFRVEDVTVEEKICEPKKEIYFTAEVEATPVNNNKSSIDKISKRKITKKDVKRIQKNNSYDQNDSDDQDNENTDNFWDKIGKRETIYLNKRKQILQDEIDKNRRAMFWYPECEESGINNEIEQTRTIVENIKDDLIVNDINNQTNCNTDKINEENISNETLSSKLDKNIVIPKSIPCEVDESIIPEVKTSINDSLNNELTEIEKLCTTSNNEVPKIIEVDINLTLNVTTPIEVSTKSRELENEEIVESTEKNKAFVSGLTKSINDGKIKLEETKKESIDVVSELKNDIEDNDDKKIKTKIKPRELENKDIVESTEKNKVLVSGLTESINDGKIKCEEIKKESADVVKELKNDIEDNNEKTKTKTKPTKIKNEIINVSIEIKEDNTFEPVPESNVSINKNKKNSEDIKIKGIDVSSPVKIIEKNKTEIGTDSETNSCIIKSPEAKICDQSVKNDSIHLEKQKVEILPVIEDIPASICDVEIASKVGEVNKAEIVEKERTPTSLNNEDKSNVKSPVKRPVKDEPAIRPLIATPRPLQKKSPQVIRTSSSSESSSEKESSDDENDDADESDTSEESEFYECENNPDGRTSTGSNDSGFDSSAPTSPAGIAFIKKDCDVNCHRKCEKLTANLCGVNQRLLVEALASRTSSKRGGEPSGVVAGGSTASSTQAAEIKDVLEQELEASTAYGLFRKTGRFTPPARSIPRFRKYTMEDFHFIKVLGKGSFGKVLLAELRETEYYYAVKCLKKDVVLEDDDVECTLIERKVLALGTNHPYLCHLFATFQTDSHLFFVMEYLNGGDLMFHIQQSGRFPEARARFYGAEVVSGLKFLHKRGIVYRDLKLDNILLDFDGHVRIADFGMCKLQIYLEKTADTFCGTPDYMAPEIVKGLKYNQTVDWWSFGVLLYEMLIGQSPFSGCDEDELFWSICNEMPSYPRFLSTESLTILTRLLDKDARTRLGGTECMHGDIREDEFFRSIHWERLERRELDAPFKPRVRHPLDTQYFDRAFTGERPRLTAVEPQVLRSMDQEPFRGFSYTNPNATDR